MAFTREKVLDALISVLYEIQKDVTEQPERITEETVPTGDLCDFDSLTSVDATVRVLVSLGFETEEFPSYPSIFVRKHQALTVAQVVDRILKLNSKRN